MITTHPVSTEPAAVPALRAEARALLDMSAA